MSFLKAVFFTLPLMAIAAAGLAYYLSTQMIQPRVEEVLQNLEAATTQMEAATETLQDIDSKLDTLLTTRP